MAFKGMSGQSLRVGGITADFLHYTDNDDVTPECSYMDNAAFSGTECEFSLGAFDELLSLADSAGVSLMFDLNELTGRDCTQAYGGSDKDEFCGDDPLLWNTTSVEMLLRHVRDKDASRLSSFIGFELGNELQLPMHLTKAAANNDLIRLSHIFDDIWGSAVDNSARPNIYAFGKGER